MHDSKTPSFTRQQNKKQKKAERTNDIWTEQTGITALNINVDVEPKHDAQINCKIEFSTQF